MRFLPLILNIDDKMSGNDSDDYMVGQICVLSR